LISKSSVHYPRPKSKDNESKYWLELDLHYPKACRLKISIFDPKNQSLLYWTNISYDSENTLFEHFIKDYQEEGTSKFRIEILNLETQEKTNQLIIK